MTEKTYPGLNNIKKSFSYYYYYYYCFFKGLVNKYQNY